MTTGMTTGKRLRRTGRDAYLAACAQFGIEPDRKKPDPKEYRLQCAVADELRAHARRDVFWTSIPMGELRTKATGAKVKASGGRAGSPDLIFVVKGRVYGLELKAADGAGPTELQEAAGALLEAAGGVYAVAKGMEAAMGLLIGWGVFRQGFTWSPSRRLQPSLAFDDSRSEALAELARLDAELI